MVTVYYTIINPARNGGNGGSQGLQDEIRNLDANFVQK